MKRQVGKELKSSCWTFRCAVSNVTPRINHLAERKQIQVSHCKLVFVLIVAHWCVFLTTKLIRERSGQFWTKDGTRYSRTIRLAQNRTITFVDLFKVSIHDTVDWFLDSFFLLLIIRTHLIWNEKHSFVCGCIAAEDEDRRRISEKQSMQRLGP